MRNGLPDVHYLGAQLRPHPAAGEVLPCSPSAGFPCRRENDTMFSVFLLFVCAIFFFFFLRFFGIKPTSTKMLLNELISREVKSRRRK